MGTLYSKPPEGSHSSGGFYHVVVEVGLGPFMSARESSTPHGRLRDSHHCSSQTKKAH